MNLSKGYKLDCIELLDNSSISSVRAKIIFSRVSIEISLSLDNLRNLKFPFPDLQEQNQICAVIEEKTDNISSTINNELKRISLIKEYRKSLISSVVSGKVCVTGDML